MIIRNADDQDILQITRIYNQCILEGPLTAQLDPVSVADREVWYQSQDRLRYPVYVAEAEKSILGYLYLGSYRSGRRALEGVAEISYFMDEKHRGSGVGSALMIHALSRCPSLNITTLLAILLETNRPSIILLKKFGFQRWGHFPGIARIEDEPVGQEVYGLHLDPENMQLPHKQKTV